MWSSVGSDPGRAAYTIIKGVDSMPSYSEIKKAVDDHLETYAEKTFFKGLTGITPLTQQELENWNK